MFSHKKQIKTLEENVLNMKTAEFYLRGINKQAENYRDLFQINAEYNFV